MLYTQKYNSEKKQYKNIFPFLFYNDKLKKYLYNNIKDNCTVCLKNLDAIVCIKTIDRFNYDIEIMTLCPDCMNQHKANYEEKFNNTKIIAIVTEKLPKGTIPLLITPQKTKITNIPLWDCENIKSEKTVYHRTKKEELTQIEDNNIDERIKELDYNIKTEEEARQYLKKMKEAKILEEPHKLYFQQKKYIVYNGV